MTNSIGAGRVSFSRVAAAAALAVCAAAWARPAVAGTVFTTGPFVLPEAITPGPGGSYLVSDADTDTAYAIPGTGGAPTASQNDGFRTFGETQLGSFYGSENGTYLAYGQNTTGTAAIASLVGTNGLGAPVNVITSSSSTFYTNAAVAPTAFRGASAGQVVLGVVHATGAGTIEALNANLSGTTTIATLAGLTPLGVGFAPASFGAKAGDLFVSDTYTGNLYTVGASGTVSLFATLPLPKGYTQPGLRQFAWAPAGFGQYGGDLFVSVAAQNGGGGTNGEIDVLNALGITVALYAQGNGAIPLDPRGLLFASDQTLLTANAEPEIDSLVPGDFKPASQVLGVPEPAGWTPLLGGLLAIAGLSRRRRGA